MGRAHPRTPAGPERIPASLLAPRASPHPSWHRGLAPRAGWVPSLARDPESRRPPRLREAFQASRWGRERRQEEEESRKGYFLTLHILQVEHFVHFSPACKSISASAPGLDGGACESTAAGDDVAAGGGTGWEEGPPRTGTVWGVPLIYWPGQNSSCSVMPAATIGFIPPGWHRQVGTHTHTLLLPSCLTLLEIKYPG